MVILTIYVYHDLKPRLNQRLNWPKRVQKAFFLTADPEGPKDRDLDPSPKID